MATLSTAMRFVLEQYNDTGESPAKDFDERLQLAAFTDHTPGRRLQLQADDEDRPFTFTNAVALLIFSHDEPFALRLAADETLMSGLRMFVVWGDAVDGEVVSTSVLLTGNGETDSDLEIWIIEKTT